MLFAVSARRLQGAPAAGPLIVTRRSAMDGFGSDGTDVSPLTKFEGARQIAGGRPSPRGQVRHLDAEPGLDEPKQRGVVERVRADEPAPAERRYHQHGNPEAEPDWSGDTGGLCEERAHRQVLAGGSHPGGRRRNVVENPPLSSWVMKRAVLPHTGGFETRASTIRAATASPYSIGAGGMLAGEERGEDPRDLREPAGRDVRLERRGEGRRQPIRRQDRIRVEPLEVVVHSPLSNQSIREGVQMVSLESAPIARLGEEAQPAPVGYGEHARVPEPGDAAVGAEVVIEGAVLLEQDPDVVDVAETSAARRLRERPGGR
jgi:hypothetical protein